MCGIVGIIGSLDYSSDPKFMKYSLIMDVVRGKDSTGAFAVDRTQEVSWFKQAVLPNEFMEAKGYATVLKTGQGGVGMIGHNRAATLGKVDDKNAHPFHHYPITGVHNGTLFEFPDTGEAAFGTDSEAIFYALSKCETLEASKKLLESLDGAFALVWYNQEDEAWYVIRNDERPLHYAEVVSTVGAVGSQMTKTQHFISSELGILYAAANKAGITIDVEDIKEFTTNHLFRFKVEAGNSTLEDLGKLDLLDPWSTSYGSWAKQYGSYTNSSSSSAGVSHTYLNSIGKNLKDLVGINPMWQDAKVTGFEPYGKDKDVGTLHGTLTLYDEEYEFRMHSSTKPKEDDVRVFIAGLSLTGYENPKRADSGMPIVLSVTDWTDIQPFGTTLDQLCCLDCGLFFSREECTIVDTVEGTCICDKCMEWDVHSKSLAVN